MTRRKRGQIYLPVDLDFIDAAEYTAGIPAAWLFLRLCAWSKRQLSDGLVPEMFARTNGEQTANELRTLSELGWIESGYVYKGAAAYRIVGFLERNDSREEVEEKRALARERMRSHRASVASDSDPGAENVRANKRRTNSEVREKFAVSSVLCTLLSNSLDQQVEIPEDPKPDQVRARAPANDSPSLPPPVAELTDEHERRHREAVGLLIRGYAERYQAAAGDGWFAYDANRRHVESVAVYVASQADPVQAAAELLDGFYADEWAREKRWPWAALAKDPARYRGGTGASEKQKVAAIQAEIERLREKRRVAYETEGYDSRSANELTDRIAGLARRLPGFRDYDAGKRAGSR